MLACEQRDGREHQHERLEQHSFDALRFDGEPARGDYAPTSTSNAPTNNGK